MAKPSKDRFSSPPAIGGISLLVIFAVLSLTVFALLSLSTVLADRRLADASAQAVEDYYAADVRAQEILARIRNGEEPEEVSIQFDPFDSAVRYSYACPISETQELQVEVVIDETSGEYTIERWQAAPIGDWSPDDSMQLWDGELPA